MAPRELFLSHSSKDARFVNRLAGTLRAHGIPVWISTHNLIGAQQWHDEIGAALMRCDWFAVVLTPNAVASKWVKRELMFALELDDLEHTIVPILAEPCDFKRLSWTLGTRQFVDFSVGSEDGLRDLLRIWGIGLDPARNHLAEE